MKTWMIAGATFAFLGVSLGAFGAHALKARLAEDMLAVFEVGVRYQMYHAMGLLGVAFAASKWDNGLINTSGWLMIAGILIFSGSLYILSLSGVRWLGAITPIGGVCFLAAWGLLIAGVVKAG